jgi:trans-AT polyketide synthase/acyltransferase/oxidoreductase domain-containing protein
MSFPIAPEALGSEAFRQQYRARYAYVAGAMFKGIASRKLVVAMGQSGLMSYFGTGGLALKEIADAIQHIQSHLAPDRPYGMNLLAGDEILEERTVEMFIDRQIAFVEAAAYTRITPALVRYRLSGLHESPMGGIRATHHVLAKVSRPEVAAAFMHPPPMAIVAALLQQGRITAKEAELSAHVPMASDICVEGDSGGHTDHGLAVAIVPSVAALRDRTASKGADFGRIRIGMAGGIGTPEAVASAFTLGADFVLTGSINQCTVEAGTSDTVKDLLQTMNVRDTTYAPAGDMFEMGAKVQVLKKGVLFAARANQLYQLYLAAGSIDEIPETQREKLELTVFKKKLSEVWRETRDYYQREHPGKLREIEASPKRKMAALFRWYFINSNRLALKGDPARRADYQVHTSAALGAFNDRVKGTRLENWRARQVAEIAELLMTGAASLLSDYFERLTAWQPKSHKGSTIGRPAHQVLRAPV